VEWTELASGAECAQGERYYYLVWSDAENRQVSLTRWPIKQRGWPTAVVAAGVARQACQHLVTWRVGPGSEPETRMQELRTAAEQFERGTGDPGLNHPDWLCPPPAGPSSVPDVLRTIGPLLWGQLVL
jgi:hypothetical protein